MWAPLLSVSVTPRSAEATVLHMHGALQSWPEFYALKKELPVSGRKQERAQISLEKVMGREFLANEESSTAKLGFDANQPLSKCLMEVARHCEFPYGKVKLFFTSCSKS